MVAKRNVLKSQFPLLLVAATALVLTIIYFVYQSFSHSKCDSIFEQTADRLRGNLEVIKIKGELVLGREKVQELTEGSQKVALHLKTCCIAQQAGAMKADQFQDCVSGAKNYETKIIQVATNIKEVKAAEEQQKPELAKQKTEQAKEAASEAISTERTLANTSEVPPAAESKAAPVEKVKRLARPQRTITVLKPEIELPALMRIVVVAAGEADNPMASIRLFNAGEANRYDEPIRIPPDVKTEKFDVVWLPKNGRRIILVRDLAFDQEHPYHEIKPDEHIGLVRLGGKKLPKAKAIYLAEPGANKMTVRLSAVQDAEKYGENMAAPLGTYDVYIDVADEKRLELVAEKLEVKAGTVTEVE